MSNKPAPTFGKRPQSAFKAAVVLRLEQLAIVLGTLAVLAVVVGVNVGNWSDRAPVQQAVAAAPYDRQTLPPPADASTQVAVVAPGPSWVFVRTISRRTCASEACGNVGNIDFRQFVDVYEVEGDWARITNFYDGACVNGRSDYVDSSDSSCSTANGFRDGRFAEWVPLQSLTAAEPAERVMPAGGFERYVASSDDVDVYGDQFVAGARKLVDRGACTTQQVQDSGGFLKSMNNKAEPYYFILCDDRRIYLDVVTGRIWE